MTRYLPLLLAVLALVLGVELWVFDTGGLTAHLLLWPGLALTMVGAWDLVQSSQAVRRNYPIIGRMRYLLESIRPELRQYFFESDLDGTPFSRAQRAVVYQRAKASLDKRPFGTQLDYELPGHEWLTHSIAPCQPDPASMRVQIGGPDCRQPYSSSVLNISAMSFGSLSGAAIRALNEGARRGGFAHDTGEGSISEHHRIPGGDLVWELGSGYFGCRDARGRFDPVRFAEQAANAQVKMVELKLSQGAKPGHGGILPAAKVSPEIAKARGVPQGVDCVSPANHPEFSTPVGLLEFVARLRELSGGKPVGFKLCVGHPWEFLAIVRAMLDTGIVPDFIVIDGAEGGTGASPPEFADHVGMPLRDGLLLAANALVGAGLRDRIRIGVSGKIVTGFDMARVMALGADWCNSARGFMFALGCIQAQSCHTDRCPTGIATQDPIRQRGLDVDGKAARVHRFQANTVHALGEVLGAAGLLHPSQLRPWHLNRRISRNESRRADQLYEFLQPGSLLGDAPLPAPFSDYWRQVRSDSFALR
jgi:glutamate synthase domain-containing protein 2